MDRLIYDLNQQMFEQLEAGGLTEDELVEAAPFVNAVAENLAETLECLGWLDD